jgi:hypothetical protein
MKELTMSKKQSIIIHYRQSIEITEEELRLAIQRGAIEVDDDGDVHFVNLTDELIAEVDEDIIDLECVKVEYCWFNEEGGNIWEVEW